METNSKLFEQIRIRKKSQSKPSVEMQKCQWDDCKNTGHYRAPVGQAAEGRYFIFCLEHVRKYNRDFNYFSGVQDSEIAQMQKEAIAGDKKTWKISKEDTKKTSNFYAGQAGYNYTKIKETLKKQNIHIKPTLKPLEIAALENLGLDTTATKITIRKRYTELIKLHHPDFNGGDRTTEEQFQKVLHAYRILKKANLC